MRKSLAIFFHRCFSPIKPIKFLTVCFFAAYFLVSCSPVPVTTPSVSKDALELQKLALEVQQLARDISLTPLTLLAGVAGVGGILFTIIQGLQTVRQQAQDRRNELVSKYLADLISDSAEKVRLGAAAGLASYVNEPNVVETVLTALGQEQSPVIIEALEQLLSRVNQRGLDQVLQANRKSLETRARLLGQLNKEGAKTDFSYALLGFTPAYAEFIRGSHADLYEHGKSIQTRHQERNRNLGRSGAEDNQMMIDLADQELRIARATAGVFSIRLKQGGSTEGLVGQVDFSETDLYGVDLSRLNLRTALLVNCLMQHAQLSNAVFDDADLSGSRLIKAVVENTHFNRANLTHTFLIEAKGPQAIFDGSCLEHASFKQGVFDDCSFKRTSGMFPEFKDASLRRAIFDHAEMSRPIFINAHLEGASLVSAKLVGGDFSGAFLSGANLTGAKLNGSNLCGTEFRNAVLDRTDFSGADLDGADFKDAMIQGAVFKSVRNLDKALNLPAQP